MTKRAEVIEIVVDFTDKDGIAVFDKAGKLLNLLRNMQELQDWLEVEYAEWK